MTLGPRALSTPPVHCDMVCCIKQKRGTSQRLSITVRTLFRFDERKFVKNCVIMSLEH